MEVKFFDVVKGEFLGFSSNENIENFSTQEISDQFVDFSIFPEVETTKVFEPREVWFFDSTSSLDFVLMTRKGIIGFITVSLGVIKTNYREPINAKNIEYEVKRFIILPEEINTSFNSLIFELNDYKFNFSAIYRSRVNKVEVLWKELFLQDILPKLERDFIINRLSQYLSDEVVLIKDGLLGELVNSDSCRYMFGYVKNFSFPDVIFDDPKFRAKDKRTGIYVVNGGVGFHSYINLGYSKELGFIDVNRGIYNYSRVDIAGYSAGEVENIVSRYNFITDYSIYLTSLFSSSNRFPQNLPIIEFLESFLRNASGNREIVRKAIQEVVLGDVKVYLI